MSRKLRLKVLAGAVATTAVLAVPAGNASAFQAGAPPGPPFLSGGGALVFHFCERGVLVINRGQGIHTVSCRDGI